MSQIVATYEAKITLRAAELMDAPPPGGDVFPPAVERPTIAEFERIVEEALRSYKAAFGVDEINVTATRTDE